MDLRPTDEQQAISETLHDLCEHEIRPSAREAEEAGRPPEAVVKQLFEMGVSVPIPEEFGGQGTFDAVTSVIIAEEIAWGDPGVAFSVLGSGLAATLIDLAGTDEQRSSLLPRFSSGAVGSIALAERDAGADLTQMEASAISSGESTTLNGTKYAVPAADIAPIRLLVTNTKGRLGLWLIPEDAEIVAHSEDKLGLRSANTFKIILDNLAVPKDSLIGSDVADPRKLELALLRAKLLNAGIALGLARASLEYASDYAKERTAFGKPIGAFQGISFKIADRATDLEGARLMVWKAAKAVDDGEEGSSRAVMSACGHAVAAAVTTADDGVQILGGHGYMRDHPQELWYRDAMTLATLDSPSMIGDLFLAGVSRAEKEGAIT